ncbi:MAG: hypothetical protein ACODTU_11375 [Pigmentiphaga sp.]|uniref:hypothetical protein n=1 Tax=Pigmentiphaga sp. TaxID=1977564 RepID=UPI003B5549E6
MGLLESAAGTAADKADSVAGKDSTLGGLIDDVAGKLGGGAGGVPSGTPYYYARETLNDKLGQPQKLFLKPTAQGSESQSSDENRGSRPMPIEFIHFGKVHGDMNDTFAGKGPPGHGVGCRDALLRETMLLFSFVDAAKHVLETNMQGAIGNAMETVGSLLGSGQKSAAVGPEQFTPLLVKIQATGDKLNVGSIDYPTLHQAGVDLHQVRADFAVLCASAFKPGAGGGAGLPSLPLPGPLGAVGGVGGFIADIPKYLFKAQDTYKAMFQAARAEYEAGIEEACRAFSVAAIRDGREPTFGIWFFEKEAPDAQGAAPPEPPKTYADNPLGKAEKAVDDAQDKIEEAQEKAKGAQESLTDWLETAGARTRPGTAALAAAFATLAGGTRWNEPRTDPKNLDKIVPAPVLISRAIAQGTGIQPLPGFVDTVVQEIAKASVAILERVYTNLLLAAGDGDLRVLTALSTREALSKLIVDLVFKLAGFPPPGDNKKAEGETQLGKVSMGKQQLLNKGAELLRDFLTRHAAHLDVIIDFIAEELSAELQKMRGQALSKDARTMEIWLGRLPMLLALQVRNTLFPLFNLLLDAFGLGDTVGQTVWNPVRDKIKQATGMVQDVKHTKDNLLEATEQAKESGKKMDDAVSQLGDNKFNFLDPANSAKDMKDKVGNVDRARKDGVQDVLDKATGADEDKARSLLAGGDEDAPPAGDAPFSNIRVSDSAAVRPEKPDIDQVGKVVLGTEAA